MIFSGCSFDDRNTQKVSLNNEAMFGSAKFLEDLEVFCDQKIELQKWSIYIYDVVFGINSARNAGWKRVK